MKETESQLCRVSEACDFRVLSDLEGLSLERWLFARESEGMAAATRNEYRGAFLGFVNWCIQNRRLAANPFDDVPRADVKSDRRRRRRALTEDELEKLLDAARRRPLLDAMTIRRGQEQGQGDCETQGTDSRTARKAWGGAGSALQDLPAIWAPQVRIGFPDGGTIGARRADGLCGAGRSR